jgi:GT2 family glycosyltransferase
MTDTPAVSVIMAAYNADRFVGQAVASILSQTMEDFEFIVVDDGSTDATAEVVRSHDDPRIRMLSFPHRGIPAARNAGIAAARAPYIACMDADDVSAPERLARQLEHMRANSDCVVVGTWARYIDVANHPLGILEHPIPDQEIRCTLHIANQFVHGSTLASRAAIIRAGGYDESLPVVHDYHLWFRLARLGTLANLPTVLYELRLHADSTSAEDRVATFRAAIRVRQNALGRIPPPAPEPGSPDERRLSIPLPDRTAEAEARLTWAMTFNDLRSTRDALRQAGAAVFNQPSNFHIWRFFIHMCLVAIGARRVKRLLARGSSTSAARTVHGQR